MITHLPSALRLPYAAEERRDAQLICEVADTVFPKSFTTINQLTHSQLQDLYHGILEAVAGLGFVHVAEIPDVILHKVNGKPRSRKLLKAVARAWFSRGRHWSRDKEVQSQASQRFCEVYPSLTTGREGSLRKLLDRVFAERHKNPGEHVSPDGSTQ